MGPVQFSVADVHEAIAATRPDEVCLVHRDRRLTWAELTDRTRRLANHLIEQGLGCHTERGQLQGHESGQDHLAIYLHNGTEYLEAMLGSFKARVAPFNVNYRYVAEELHYLLTDSQATAIVVHSQFTPTLAEVLPDLPRLRVILQVPDESGLPLLPGAVWYAGGLVAVADVSLTLGRGSVTALMGRNGCGKSSLLWALQGTGTRSSGSVLIGTGPTSVDPARLAPAERRRRIGLVPQTASDLLYLDSVGAELAVADRESQAAAGTAARLLNRLAPGIDEAQHPRDLSEGQQLALVLAVQLCAGPEVILLDEPTRGLDYAGKEALAGVLHDLAEEGRSVLVSTHDVEFVAECAEHG